MITKICLATSSSPYEAIGKTFMPLLRMQSYDLFLGIANLSAYFFKLFFLGKKLT